MVSREPRNAEPETAMKSFLLALTWVACSPLILVALVAAPKWSAERFLPKVR